MAFFLLEKKLNDKFWQLFSCLLPYFTYNKLIQQTLKIEYRIKILVLVINFKKLLLAIELIKTLSPILIKI
jgi:hypothetical protein